MAKSFIVVSAAGWICSIWDTIGRLMAEIMPDEVKCMKALHDLSNPHHKNAQARLDTAAHVLLGCITDRQRRAIELLIIESPIPKKFTQKALIWLLRESNNLSQSVRASFVEGMDAQKRSKFATIGDNVHRMRSATGRTSLPERLALLGVRVFIQTNQLTDGCEVFFSTEYQFDYTAEVIPVDMDEIEAVDLLPAVIRGESFYWPESTNSQRGAR